MYRVLWVLMVVVCMAIWSFANSGKAQEGRDTDVSTLTLSERIDALERKVHRLEDKINRLEKRPNNGEVDGSGVPTKPAFVSGVKGPCPGEWRRIGGGWICSNSSAK